MDRKPCIVTAGEQPRRGFLIGFVTIKDQAHGVVQFNGETRFDASELQHYPFKDLQVFDGLSEAQQAEAMLNEPKPEPKTSPAKTKRTQPATV